MPLTPLVISATTNNNNNSTSPNLPPSSNSTIPSASVLISASNQTGVRRNTTNNNNTTYGSASATVIGVGRSLQSRGGKQNVMIPLGTMGNTPTTVHNYQTPRKDDPVINNSNFENSPISSNHSNSHSKEYEQVNQVFDGLSSSIHQLYHQLKQTQESIRKISESQPSSLNNSFNTSVGEASIIDPNSYSSPSVGRYHNQYNSSMEEALESSAIIRNDDSIVLSDADEIISLENTLGNTTTTNTTSSINTGSMLNLEPFLHQTVSTSMLQDSSVFHDLKSELDFKNEENLTLKLRIEQLTNLISTLEERANSSINLIEPAKQTNYIPKSEGSAEQIKQLKEQLAIQQEINRMQNSKIENYESAIQIILTRSHDKIQDITQENSRMTELLQQENGTLQAINNKLLLQNTILKSKLLEMIQVMRDAARERDLELINYESLLNANIKERDVLVELLNIGKQYGNIQE
ncbi:hypothetical protein NAEGRDRAFT_78596 [Naegleria gruberi]|uniref:Uncharacterized protein n=1 Tax=Naegleria gruberi TaxID=5762 RepID=D2V4U0_NAEGR|nr:uncharacterized protein NAEGRDRAFT_78596 [Naegleria gruberi]EFC48161.1 hypothetical protein NAEGRDRAFT_78596 [Naegleria gruberi]|eukprot:XP_002680905.1 hypothetical protein NAEGRDRAFT_78596 [Naegleria gruberi strain NEG-M]